MNPIPDVGSFFHEDNWLGFVLPGPDDVAKFGTGLDPDGHSNRPHHIHFGDACLDVSGCPNDIPIPGGDMINQRLDIQSGSWTFDFDTLNFGCPPPGDTTGSYALTRPGSWSVAIGNIMDETCLPGAAELTLEGPGSLNTTGYIYVGLEGEGTLTVEGGASVENEGTRPIIVPLWDICHMGLGSVERAVPGRWIL